MRQHVAIEYLLEPYVKHRFSPLPKRTWPYYDERDSATPAQMLAFMEAFDKAAQPKEGGGYALSVPLDAMIEAAHGS